MTERKPGNMSFESWIEAQINEAQRRGEFDNLPGKGKPLKGIDEPYDELWWVKQLMVREELSYLPPALELRRDIERVVDGIGALPSERAVRTVIDDLNTRIRAMNRMPPVDGPALNRMPLDVDTIVERWRQARAAMATEVTEAADADAATPPAPTSAQPEAVRRLRWWRARPSV